MNISMDKIYTLDGNQFTVLTVTKPGIFSVLGHSSRGTPHEFQADGRNAFCRLVKVSPYADFVIDEPVMVRDLHAEQWQKRYFAGVNPIGEPLTFNFGNTKWSNKGYAQVKWNHCRRPTAEELAT